MHKVVGKFQALLRTSCKHFGGAEKLQTFWGVELRPGGAAGGCVIEGQVGSVESPWWAEVLHEKRLRPVMKQQGAWFEGKPVSCLTCIKCVRCNVAKQVTSAPGHLSLR